MGPTPKNRWTRAIERSESPTTAAAMFALHVAGLVASIVAVWVGLGGLLLVTGTLGRGWAARLGGVGLMVAAGMLLALGRWAATQFAVQRR